MEVLILLNRLSARCPISFPELGKSFFISRLVYPSDLSSRSSDPLFPALASLSALALSPRLSDFPELAIPSP